MLVSTPSNTALFAVLAVDHLFDLKAAGIAAACRAIPRRRRS